jgi:seryl-tRNA synthetase
MSRDFDDIYKKIDQSSKELYKKESQTSKSLDTIDDNQRKMMKEITEIKKEIKDIAFKVETMLEILNNFTLLLVEDDEDLDENYDVEDEGTWVPKDDNFWENDDESDLEDENYDG